MGYVKTNWVNGGVNPINETNLNHIESGIEDIYTEMSGLLYTESVTLASNMSINANVAPATATYQLTPQTGYTPVMVTLENTWDGRVGLWYVNLDSTNAQINWRVRNNSSSNVTGISIKVRVLYAKTSF